MQGKDKSLRAAVVRMVKSSDAVTCAAVGAMFLINGVCIANWLARVPSVRLRLKLDDLQLGMVLLSTAVGSMVAMRLSNRIVHRFGSRTLTIAAGCAFCTCVMGPSLASSPWMLAGFLFFLGLASGLMGVSMNSQAVELERRSKKSILSSFHGLFSLGNMLGAAMGAAAANANLGLLPHLAMVSVGGVAVVLLAGRRLLPDGRAAGPRQTRLILSRAIIMLALLVFCSSIGEGAMADWTGVYLHDILGADMGTAALGYTAFATAMLVGRFAGDALTSRLGDARTLRAAGIFVMAGMGIGLSVNTLPFMLVGISGVGFGLSVVVPITFRAASRNPEMPTSAALGTLAALGYSGFLVGPALIGALSHMTNLRTALALVPLLGLPIAVFAGSVRPTTE